MDSNQLKQEFIKVKTSYEEYFRGNLKFEPVSMKDRFYRELMNSLRDIKVNSEKIKLKNLLYSYNTHKQKWDSMLRNIEKGIINRKSDYNSKNTPVKSFNPGELIRSQVESLIGSGEKGQKIVRTLMQRYGELSSEKQGRPIIQFKDGKIKMKIQLGND